MYKYNYLMRVLNEHLKNFYLIYDDFYISFSVILKY
jgi:hypothetical protein